MIMSFLISLFLSACTWGRQDDEECEFDSGDVNQFWLLRLFYD